ncbi:MAG: polyamine ABC transporter substrate-binding protein [Gammaproteobacteria bacterium]|nr:polyamine ABC transporter substrate-binding protein [Gammaproteobacteria bacterium]
MKASLLGLVLSLPLAIAASAAEPPLLNVYNWSDYIDPQIIDNFEAEYGIKVNYDTYASSEMVDTKLMTGHSGYDIVLHSAGFSARLIPIGIYLPAEFDRLENWRHIDPDILARTRKNYPGKLVGVPYMWGTTGFTYNVDLIRERMPDAPIDSASLVFDPEIVSRFADCGVSLLDDPLSVIPMAMLYLGYPANSVAPEHLRDVEKLLKSVRPYIKYFSSTKMLLDLPSEEICIAMSWSGDYSVATARAAEAGLAINLAFNIPKEGSIEWIDTWFIPADAPHPNNAHLWLDYLLRPEVIASASNFTGYANANRTATALVDPAITSDVAIYPDQTTMSRLHAAPVLPPKLERRRSRTWIKIKTGL